MSWLDEEARLREDLEEIQRTGYAFGLARTHVMPDRQERRRQWPHVEDWEPPPPRALKVTPPPRVFRQPKPVRPLQPVRQPRPTPAQLRALHTPSPAVQLTCHAPDAFAIYSYSGHFEEAQRRMKAGAHQAKCLACMRYRWADEPCDHARFAGGKGPRPEQVPA